VALVDVKERQLTIKLVYYGPPLSGKTTNLRHIHQSVAELNRGRLMTLDTKDDRTLFFDLLPIFFQRSGLSFRIKVYTVPGQPLHEATRRIVLQGADGIAFVADARRSEVRTNNESFHNMKANLERLGLTAGVPVVIQYNKCDLPDTLTEEETRGMGSTADEVVFRAVALEGTGVMDTFLGLVERAWISLDGRLNFDKLFGIRRGDFMSSLRDHVAPP
jgi:signal recognition particle receptor subunit beta